MKTLSTLIEIYEKYPDPEELSNLIIHFGSDEERTKLGVLGLALLIAMPTDILNKTMGMIFDPKCEVIDGEGTYI